MSTGSDIERAVMTVESGGVIVFPTDTAYGMGCRIDDKRAVDRVFRIRNRSRNKPTPVLVSSIKMAEKYFRSPKDIVRRYMESYWPGALTIVWFCNKKNVYSPIRGSGNTIGVRMPDHSLVLDIIAKVGVPIIGTSANFSGEQTPYSVDELDSKLVRVVDYVLEGECKHGAASTVVDCTGKEPEIIRQGAVELHD